MTSINALINVSHIKFYIFASWPFLSGPHNHQLENSSQKFYFSLNGLQVGGGGVACPLWKNARGVTPPRLSGSRVPGYILNVGTE